MFKGRRQFADRELPKCGSSCMAYVTNIRSKSPVESFYRDVQKTPIGTCEAVTYRNDIYMVLNQKRLSSMTLSQFSDYLNTDKSDTVLQQIRSKMNDEQLLQFTKSRYIQSISELRAWGDYLEYAYKDELSRLSPSGSDNNNVTVDATSIADTSAPSE